MSINYEDIKKANDAIKTMSIQRKKKDGTIVTNEYAEVNQRIKAFRMVYPEGFIITELMSDSDGVCKFRAVVGFYDEDGDARTIGTGSAYEVDGSSFINSTSYIENCETSAVGRALGMAGFGIDLPVASAEEVQTAIANQEKTNRKASPKQVALLKAKYKGQNLIKLLETNGIQQIEDMSLEKASEIIRKLGGK